jgi:hypothetical protein
MNDINPYQAILNNWKTNPCKEIPLITATQRPHRFTKCDTMDIPVDEENEGYELTRFVMFEKIKKPEEFGIKLHELVESMMKIGGYGAGEIVLGITKTRPKDGNFKISLNKVYL